MKMEHKFAHSLVILVGFIVFGYTGLKIYHNIHTRESYNITECGRKYQFLNMTIYREIRLGVASAFRPQTYLLATTLFIYSVQELQEKGFLNTLYSEATIEPEVFLNYRERNTDDAVVLLKTIFSPNKGKEPIYCVVNKKEVSVVDLLNSRGIFFVGIQEKRTKYNFPSLKKVRKVVSWVFNP